MTQLWLVRHGRARGQAGRAVGSTDLALDGHGKHQARRAALALKARPLDAVYSSDRVRAIATAEAIAASHGLDVEIRADLRELDFGAWEQRDLAQLWEEAPELAEAWAADITAIPDGFGEGFDELSARVASFASQLAQTGHREVAVVAHRGSLTALLAHCRGISFAQAWQQPLGHGMVCGCVLAPC